MPPWQVIVPYCRKKQYGTIFVVLLVYTTLCDTNLFNLLKRFNFYEDKEIGCGL